MGELTMGIAKTGISANTTKVVAVRALLIFFTTKANRKIAAKKTVVLAMR